MASRWVFKVDGVKVQHSYGGDGEQMPHQQKVKLQRPVANGTRVPLYGAGGLSVLPCVVRGPFF